MKRLISMSAILFGLALPALAQRTTCGSQLKPWQPLGYCPGATAICVCTDSMSCHWVWDCAGLDRGGSAPRPGLDTSIPLGIRPMPDMPAGWPPPQWSGSDSRTVKESPAVYSSSVEDPAPAAPARMTGAEVIASWIRGGKPPARTAPPQQQSPVYPGARIRLNEPMVDGDTSVLLWQDLRPGKVGLWVAVQSQVHEADWALVQVFFRVEVEIDGKSVGLLRSLEAIAPVVSEFRYGSISQPFGIAPEQIEFVRVELLHNVGRREFVW